MKRLLPIVCVFLLGLSPVWAQRHVINSSQVYNWVERMPELFSGGGVNGIAGTLARRTRLPPLCNAEVPSLQVVVSFIVGPNGVTYGERIEKPSADFRFDSSVLKAVRSLPRMKSGYHKGKLIYVRLAVPVRVCMQ